MCVDGAVLQTQHLPALSPKSLHLLEDPMDIRKVAFCVQGQAALFVGGIGAWRGLKMYQVAVLSCLTVAALELILL